MESDEGADLVRRLRELFIRQDNEIIEITRRHRQEIEELTEEFNRIQSEGTLEEKEGLPARARNYRTGSDGVPVYVGDVVTLLTSGRTGKSGDSAIITKLGRVYATVQVNTGTKTTRSYKNIKFLRRG